ncbi:MAG TPA: L,D-transpeptidase family protein, partial [Candidatus Limnocylindrales bacterium]|nr:L,D-transpeptidase family protein [Candidatus Limnocylindrales bacterium]
DMRDGRIQFTVVLILRLYCAAAAAPVQADKIVILKSAHSMTLLSGGKVLKTYKIALGSVPVGPKQVEGDHKTPEGTYLIDAKNGHSQFHLSLHISYPSAADQQRARSMGARPGGAIMIHGLAKPFAYLGPLHRQTDWTDGCVAVTNAEIEEIWKLIPVGTRVEIRP